MRVAQAHARAGHGFAVHRELEVPRLLQRRVLRANGDDELFLVLGRVHRFLLSPVTPRRKVLPQRVHALRPVVGQEQPVCVGRARHRHAQHLAQLALEQRRRRYQPAHARHDRLAARHAQPQRHHRRPAAKVIQHFDLPGLCPQIKARDRRQVAPAGCCKAPTAASRPSGVTMASSRFASRLRPFSNLRAQKLPRLLKPCFGRHEGCSCASPPRADLRQIRVRRPPHCDHEVKRSYEGGHIRVVMSFAPRVQNVRLSSHLETPEGVHNGARTSLEVYSFALASGFEPLAAASEQPTPITHPCEGNRGEDCRVNGSSFIYPYAYRSGFHLVQQLRQAVDDRLRPGRTPGDVGVHGDDLVDVADDVVAALEDPARGGARPTATTNFGSGICS